MTLVVEWRELGNCWNDPAAHIRMFPPGTLNGGDRRMSYYEANEAHSICEDCPVAVECYEYAQSWGPTHGIWGGFDPTQLRRERGRAIA